MLIEGIDHLGLSLFNEMKEKEYDNPNYIYFFNFLNIGIEISKSNYSVVEGCVSRNFRYYHVVCFNWKPDFTLIKEVYKFDYQKFKCDKWNRRFTIGDFLNIEDAKKCFLLCIKCLINEKTGVLF